MIPELRAIADRAIWEGALIAHIATSISDKDAKRTIEQSGATVWQRLAGVAAANRAAAAEIASRIGVQPDPGSSPPAKAPATLDDLLGDLFASRAELLAALGKVADSDTAYGSGPATVLLSTIRWLTSHPAESGLAVAEVLPDVALDPLVATWLAGTDFAADGRPELRERQAEYMRKLKPALQARMQQREDAG
jgi:hypothetical protein